MRDGWKEVRLGDVCTKIGSGATPRGGKEAYEEQGIPLIRSQNILDFSFSEDGLAFINSKQASKLDNATVQNGDILLNITGDSVARVCSVPNEYAPARVNQHVAIIRGNNSQIINKFILYFLQYIKKHLLSIASSGGTRNALTKSMISNQKMLLPPLPQQRAIAATLSCLDDKIELNNKINANLEAQAQAIFKSWFVDFEPFQDGEFVDSELGRIPKGWRVEYLSECCSKIARGITPKYSDESVQIILNQKCIRNHEVNIHLSRKHSPKQINDKWVQYGDILINSTGQGTLGRTAQWFLSLNNVTVDSHITIVRPGNSKYIYYLGLLIMSKEAEIESMASGSTGQTELSRERLGNIQILVPDDNVLIEFSKTISPIMNNRKINNFENSSLATIRNTLLPKLMSGEIEVPMMDSIKENICE